MLFQQVELMISLPPQCQPPLSPHLHLIKIGVGPWGAVSSDLKQISQLQARRRPTAVEWAVSRSLRSLVGLKSRDLTSCGPGKSLVQNTCWSRIAFVVSIIPSEALTRWKMNGVTSSCLYWTHSNVCNNNIMLKGFFHGVFETALNQFPSFLASEERQIYVKWQHNGTSSSQQELGASETTLSNIHKGALCGEHSTAGNASHFNGNIIWIFSNTLHNKLYLGSSMYATLMWEQGYTCYDPPNRNRFIQGKHPYSIS